MMRRRGLISRSWENHDLIQPASRAVSGPARSDSRLFRYPPSQTSARSAPFAIPVPIPSNRRVVALNLTRIPRLVCGPSARHAPPAALRDRRVNRDPDLRTRRVPCARLGAPLEDAVERVGHALHIGVQFEVVVGHAVVGVGLDEVEGRAGNCGGAALRSGSDGGGCQGGEWRGCVDCGVEC